MRKGCRNDQGEILGAVTASRLCAAGGGDTGLGRDIGESASSTLNCVLNQPKKDFLPALDRWVARAEEDFQVV